MRAARESRMIRWRGGDGERALALPLRCGGGGGASGGWFGFWFGGGGGGFKRAMRAGIR